MWEKLFPCLRWRKSTFSYLLKRLLMVSLLLRNKIINFFVKKSTCKLRLFRNVFPWSSCSRCEDEWPTLHTALSSLKWFLGRRYFGFQFFSAFFGKSCVINVARVPFFRIWLNIFSAFKKNASLFWKKVFLKGTSWIFHSLQQLKTVLQLTKYFFSFGCFVI